MQERNFKIIPFAQLNLGQRAQLGVNWTVVTRSGSTIKDWAQVADPRYGIIHHVVVIDQHGEMFDKVDLEWSPAAFVVVYRRNGDRVEFLLPTERRVLLKDENGQQGNVFIRNIPQGLVRTWQGETPQEAALREVKEETGLKPKSIIELGEVYFDAANSQTAMPFFLAEVKMEPQDYQQSLDATEEIIAGEKDWFSLEDIAELKLQCAKTMSGLLLASGFLGLWPKRDF